MTELQDDTETQPEPAIAPRLWWRRRPTQIGAAIVVIGAAVGIWAATSSSPTATAASSAASTPAPSTAATSAGTAITECSGPDHGVASGFQAWETLMKSDTDFTAWVTDTTNLQSNVQSAASTDSTFGETDGAAAASTLSTTLTVVAADLQEGAQAGEAPSSYEGDVQQVIAAEAPFQSCQS